MNVRRSAVVAGLTGLSLAAGLALGSGAAYAATTPPYEPDPQSFGTLSFYDASGNQVTSGDINAKPFAAYTVGSNAGRTGDHTTLLNMAQPNPASITANWNVDNITGATNYPLTGADPASIVTLSQSHPVSKGTSGDLSIADFIAEFPNDPAHDTNAGYQNLYQFRLITANGADQNAQYEVADVLVSGTTWTQVYPTVLTPTSTALTSSQNPTTKGSTVTLTATETPAVAGSVQFKDGATNIGSPVAVNGSGVATTTTSWSTPTAGNPPETHALSAVFTPTDTATYASSTGNLTETVNPPATPTTTSLIATQDGNAGDDVNLVATVAPSAAAGSVAFYDNGSPTAIPGTVTASGGTYTLDLPSGLSAGGHSIVAKFAPTDVTQYQASQSAPQSFLLQPPVVGACAQTGSQCRADSNVQVTVPVGTLTISTPYTTGHPLDLGGMTLTGNASLLTANAPFQNIVVTDARSGDLPYTVSALSSPLTTTKPTLGSGSVNVINAENVGLTGLAATGDASYTGALTGVHANAAANPAVQPSDGGAQGLGGTTAHDVFDSDHGLGTVTLNGTLTINAPVNTVAGLYTGTITFTVG